MKLTTDCYSYTGILLYSDTHIEKYRSGEITTKNENNVVSISHQFGGRYYYTTDLNFFAKIPIIGILAGVTRMALAIIHIIGHILAGIATGDKGHLCHVTKGGAEFCRGFIETIPIVGRIFVWCQDVRDPDFYEDAEYRKDHIAAKKDIRTPYYASSQFFLVNLVNSKEIGFPLGTIHGEVSGLAMTTNEQA